MESGDEKAQKLAQAVDAIAMLLDLSALASVCLGAEAVDEIHRDCASGRAYRNPLFLAQPSESWVRLYRRSRKSIATLEDAFAAMDWPASADRSPTLLIRDALVWISQPGGKAALTKDPHLRSAPRRVRKGARLLHRMLSGQINAHREVMQLSDRERRRVLIAFDEEEVEFDALQVPALLFLCLIAMRCWTEFGDHPARILRRARQGDLDALEFLLRIDPYIQADRGVARQMSLARISSRARWTRLTRAQLRNAAPSQKATRVNLAGLVKSLSITGKLTEPMIRDGFDFAAGFHSRDESVKDHALPEAPEAFAKGINRRLQKLKAQRMPGQK